jgi:hypothetical protein
MLAGFRRLKLLAVVGMGTWIAFPGRKLEPDRLDRWSSLT